MQIAIRAGPGYSSLTDAAPAPLFPFGTARVAPAVWGVMLAKSWRNRLLVGCVIAAAASLVGLWSSFSMELPTGAVIVVACGLALVVSAAAANARPAA